MNNVFILGRLGKDVDLKYLPGGIAVAVFVVATSEKIKEKEKTEWHTVVVYGKLAEICSTTLKKGHQVFVVGRLQTRSWDTEHVKAYKTEVIAKEIRFLTYPEKSKQQEKEQEQASNETQYFTEDNVIWTTEEIPF